MEVSSETISLLSAWDAYRTMRRWLLSQTARPTSNRDPLVEFSEQLVALTVGGQLAPSPVQKDHDIVGPTGEYIQVRCLTNPSATWVNGHEVSFGANKDINQYAVVFFEDLSPRAIMIFAKGCTSAVCQTLHKTHPNQEWTIQLTRANYQQILKEADVFRNLGVDIYELPALFSSIFSH